MKFRISTNKTFEVDGKTFGGEFIRMNDGSLIIRDEDAGDDDDAPNLRLVVPRVVQVKRSAPYDTPDPEQEAFAQRVVDLLNA